MDGLAFSPLTNLMYLAKISLLTLLRSEHKRWSTRYVKFHTGSPGGEVLTSTFTIKLQQTAAIVAASI